jgi:hypothetical protein
MKTFVTTPRAERAAEAAVPGATFRRHTRSCLLTRQIARLSAALAAGDGTRRRSGLFP